MKYTDEDLVRYADNTINTERRNRLLDAAEHNAELAEILASLDASKLPFKAAFDQQPIPPMPDSLRTEVANMVSVANSGNVTAIDEAKATRQNVFQAGWSSYLAQAACLLVCVGIGFAIGTVNRDSASTDLQSSDSAIALDTPAKSTDEQRNWVERVADYQTLYVANTVKNTKPNLEATIQQLQSLEARSGVQTVLPDLSNEGYQFARVQELGFNGQTLVQLVYTKDGNTPLALCFMLANGDSDEELRLATRHGLGTASWINNNQRFVIVGNETTESLKNLYQLASSAFAET
jgi:anti-sigma factor RsiW